MANVNRNYGKINEDGSLEYASVPLVVNGENVWTNIPEVYIAEGYYPIVRTDEPIKEGFYYTFYWEQDGNVIIQKWEEHEIPDEPIAEVATEEDINQAIQEGVNSIDN